MFYMLTPHLAFLPSILPVLPEEPVSRVVRSPVLLGVQFAFVYRVAGYVSLEHLDHGSDGLGVHGFSLPQFSDLRWGSRSHYTPGVAQISYPGAARVP